MAYVSAAHALTQAEGHAGSDVPTSSLPTLLLSHPFKRASFLTIPHSQQTIDQAAKPNFLATRFIFPLPAKSGTILLVHLLLFFSSFFLFVLF